MKCPFCGTPDSKVIDTRLNQSLDSTRRRRECLTCQARFTTYERVEEIMPLVIKKDGRREDYDRMKVIDGLKKACQKRQVPTALLEKLANSLEKKIQSFGIKEVPAHVIGQILMVMLKDIDTVAYIRFASVYRQFKDVEEFVNDLKEIPSSEYENSDQTKLFE